jgi:hypothetical protein
LARAQVLDQLEADTPTPDGFGETTHDTDLHVGLEKRGADFAEDLLDIGIAETSAATELGENPLESVCQALEHGFLRL